MHLRDVAIHWQHWLGMNNENRDGTWYWTVDGEEVPVNHHATYWDYGEPDGVDVCGEFVAGHMGFDGHWNQWKTVACWKKRPIVCVNRY